VCHADCQRLITQAEGRSGPCSFANGNQTRTVIHCASSPFQLQGFQRQLTLGCPAARGVRPQNFCPGHIRVGLGTCWTTPLVSEADLFSLERGNSCAHTTLFPCHGSAETRRCTSPCLKGRQILLKSCQASADVFMNPVC
jgi:hypothetical protein